MESNDTVVACRLFPGPEKERRNAHPLWARPLWPGGQAPAVYQIGGLTSRNWKQLWPSIVAGDPLVLRGHIPREETTDALLLFELTPGKVPLVLACRFVERHEAGCTVATDPPPLSWRLVAVDAARTLPAPPADHTPSPVEVPSAEQLKQRRLQLRVDIPCPAETLAPGDELPRAVTALRSGFYTLDQLIDELSVPPDRLGPFIAVLDTVGIVTDAPVALRTWRTPFAFLGLHWSAHDPLVRRRYQMLCADIDSSPPVVGIPAGEFLERTYQMLHHPGRRRQLRRRLLAPSTLAEVGTYFQNRLQQHCRHDRVDAAVDTARRVLELDPSNRNVRQTLTGLLCRRNAGE